MLTYTTKGFTGQYADTVTGLDYYNARCYDPAAGVFLSADTVQGDMQGMNPYGYVGGNPETMSDPTGHFYVGHNGESGYIVPDDNHGVYLYTYMDQWETVLHYNSQHEVDAIHSEPENHSKVARMCGLYCGDVKDPGVEVQGYVDIGAGASMAVFGLASLAQTGPIGASWASSGISDLLYGVRLLATNHTEVNPHFLLMLDTAKFLADTVQAMLLLYNIGHLVTHSGPRLTLMNKAGYIGNVIKGWFTGQPETMKTLAATTSSIITSFNQIASPQSGVAMPLVTDYNNILSDEQAISVYDNASQ